ncbi:MAG: diguanylate cyclase [Phycisphaerales bacterium]|nr:diguanylate cyclase [Phycisphaerales bacterium]
MPHSLELSPPAAPRVGTRVVSSGFRLLVVGAERCAAALTDACPSAQVTRADNDVDAVWLCGQEEFDRVLVHVAASTTTDRLIRRLREVSPEARIVLFCSANDEPRARRLLHEGANDYLIEPLRRADIEAAFGLATPQRPPAPAAVEPPIPAELRALVGVTAELDREPADVLALLADLTRNAFDAIGVLVELDTLSHVTGDVSHIALETAIQRGDDAVGRLALAPRADGGYGVGAADRLRAYAEWVESMVRQSRTIAHWRRLALTDDLTRLGNRRFFNDRIDTILAKAAENRSRVTLFLFDVDDFKAYNDVWGHETGDALLREVAEVLLRCTRHDDVVARVGGDEFAVVFWDAEAPRRPPSDHPADPTALTERIREAVEGHDFRCLGPKAPGPVTISGGLAFCPWDGVTREQLLRVADQALLAAKRAGKNRIQLSGNPKAE